VLPADSRISSRPAAAVRRVAVAYLELASGFVGPAPLQSYPRGALIGPVATQPCEVVALWFDR
jgi:hypothetical protein